MTALCKFGARVAAVVDDHPIFRRGLAALLKDDMGFGTVHQGASAREAIRIAEREAPDILFLDLDMPGNGIEALREITLSHPDIPCVLLTACDAAEEAIIALNLGASGYILKGVGAADLAEAIDTILGGGTFVSPSFAAKMLRAAQGPASAGAPAVHLTHREVQVLRALERGKTNREIATQLAISEKTVKFYMTNIMQKYGVTNRVAAVIAFQKEFSRAERGGAGLHG